MKAFRSGSFLSLLFLVACKNSNSALAELRALFDPTATNKIVTMRFEGQRRTIWVRDLDILASVQRAMRSERSPTPQIGTTYRAALVFDSKTSVETAIYVNTNGLLVAIPTRFEIDDPEYRHVIFHEPLPDSLKALLQALLSPAQGSTNF